MDKDLLLIVSFLVLENLIEIILLELIKSILAGLTVV